MKLLIFVMVLITIVIQDLALATPSARRAKYKSSHPVEVDPQEQLRKLDTQIQQTSEQLQKLQLQLNIMINKTADAKQKKLRKHQEYEIRQCQTKLKKLEQEKGKLFKQLGIENIFIEQNKDENKDSRSGGFRNSKANSNEENSTSESKTSEKGEEEMNLSLKDTTTSLSTTPQNITSENKTVFILEPLSAQSITSDNSTTFVITIPFSNLENTSLDSKTVSPINWRSNDFETQENTTSMTNSALDTTFTLMFTTGQDSATNELTTTIFDSTILESTSETTATEVSFATDIKSTELTSQILTRAGSQFSTETSLPFLTEIDTSSQLSTETDTSSQFLTETDTSSQFLTETDTSSQFLTETDESSQFSTETTSQFSTEKNSQILTETNSQFLTETDTSSQFLTNTRSEFSTEASSEFSTETVEVTSLFTDPTKSYAEQTNFLEDSGPMETSTEMQSTDLDAVPTETTEKASELSSYSRELNTGPSELWDAIISLTKASKALTSTESSSVQNTTQSSTTDSSSEQTEAFTSTKVSLKRNSELAHSNASLLSLRESLISHSAESYESTLLPSSLSHSVYIPSDSVQSSVDMSQTDDSPVLSLLTESRGNWLEVNVVLVMVLFSLQRLFY